MKRPVYIDVCGQSYQDILIYDCRGRPPGRPAAEGGIAHGGTPTNCSFAVGDRSQFRLFISGIYTKIAKRRFHVLDASQSLLLKEKPLISAS